MIARKLNWGVKILALQLTSQAVLNQLFNLTWPQHGDNDCTDLMGCHGDEQGELV